MARAGQAAGDGHPGGSNPDSQWNSGPFDRVLASSLDVNKSSAFAELGSAVVDRFVVPTLNPAWKQRMLANSEFVALGTVNVTKSEEYDGADRATLDSYTTDNPIWKAKSIETTHGLIRAQSEAPFLYVSGIANRLGCYSDEVLPRSYAQNTVAAHNAGIAIAWMLPNIDRSV